MHQVEDIMGQVEEHSWALVADEGETLAVHARELTALPSSAPLVGDVPKGISMLSTISRCREFACSLAFVQGADNYNFVAFVYMALEARD